MTIPRLSCIFGLALLCITPLHAAAQSLETGSLNFMEEFAIKLYNRGDIAQAIKEFERIQRLDPNNTIAQEYLIKVGQRNADIKTKPAPLTTPSSDIRRITALSADIQQLKEEISRQENNSEILKTTLRNTLSENDSLYAALNKRTREIMELREKLYATPYGKDQKELMGEINTDRVPQHAFSNRDILAQMSTATPTTIMANKNLLTHEISANEARLATLRTNGIYDPLKIAELEKALDEQRAMLAEKNTILTEQARTLAIIDKEMNTVNQQIKTTDAGYSASADGLEKNYAAMKNELSQTTASDQKIFVELMADYIANVKRIQELRASSDDHAATLQQLTFTLKNNNEAIRSLNNRIHERDEAIVNYQKLLAAANVELNAKAALIQEKENAIQEKNSALRQKEETLAQTTNELNTSNKTLLAQKDELTRTGKNLATINATLSNVQSLLKSTDAEMSGLQDEINLLKTFISNERRYTHEQSAEITAMSKAASATASEIQDLKDRIKTLSIPIANHQTPPTHNASAVRTEQRKLDEIATVLGTFTEQAKDLHAIIAYKDQELASLKDLLLKTEKEMSAQSLVLNEREEEILDLEEKQAINNREIAYMSEIIAGKKSLNTEELKKASAIAATLKKESSILQNTLASKDNQMIDMNRYLLRKNAEIENLKKTTAALEKLKIIITEKETLAQENAALLQKILEEKQTRKDRQIESSFKTATLEEAQQKTALNALKARRDLRKARTGLAVISLDLQEKEAAFAALNHVLKQKTSALDEAEKQILSLEEKLSALEFKQKAVRDVVNKRDMEVLSITRALDQAKKTLASTTTNAAAQAARIKTLENALLTAQHELDKSRQEAAFLKEQANSLRQDLITAQKIIKTHERSSTMMPDPPIQ